LVFYDPFNYHYLLLKVSMIVLYIRVCAPLSMGKTFQESVLYTTLYIYVHDCMKVRDSDVSTWVQGQGKKSQVLGAFVLLDFTRLWPFLAWCMF
jgi:hypothetical protein